MFKPVFVSKYGEGWNKGGKDGTSETYLPPPSPPTPHGARAGTLGRPRPRKKRAWPARRSVLNSFASSREASSASAAPGVGARLTGPCRPPEAAEAAKAAVQNAVQNELQAEAESQLLTFVDDDDSKASEEEEFEKWKARRGRLQPLPFAIWPP